MLGRVMGCLEQVVIHDGIGRPIYLRTFSGTADLGKNALGTMDALDCILDEIRQSQTKSSCSSRALIIDGAGNGVSTLRAFTESKYHYITILDTNQIKERKFKHVGRQKRYEYGEGFLRDSDIELVDSKERGYLFETRAIRVNWDNGRECCLITSIPKQLLNASEVVKAYFDRWLYCERQYALMKASLCFYQVVGYGKKLMADQTMKEKIKKYQNDLRLLNQQLKEPLGQIADAEQKLEKLYRQERNEKEASKIIKGKRKFETSIQEKKFQSTQRTIRQIQSKMKSIQQPHKTEFATLKKKSQEYSRIQGKTTVYHADVELDQIMTSYRLTFANILAYLAKEILDDARFEMNTLIQSILYLPGKIEHLPNRRKVYIKNNDKDPQFMLRLKKGMLKLNTLKIKHPSGVLYEFSME